MFANNSATQKFQRRNNLKFLIRCYAAGASRRFITIGKRKTSVVVFNWLMKDNGCLASRISHSPTSSATCGIACGTVRELPHKIPSIVVFFSTLGISIAILGAFCIKNDSLKFSPAFVTNDAS